MKGLSLSFKIIEPMMFRGSGEFDPFVKGAHSRASSLLLPTPSTIAGSLATYCISQLSKQMPTMQYWIEEYLSVLGNDVKIRGPVLSANNSIFVEDRCLHTFLSLEELKKKCRIEYEKFKEVKSLAELDEYFKLESFKPIVKKMRKDIRVGVGLQLREKENVKIAREGLLYSAEYLNYESFKSNKECKYSESSIEILVDVKGSLVNELLEKSPIPIKLGGETRISLMEFREGNRIFDEVKSTLWCNKEEHNGILALYLATPALFKGGKRVVEYVKDWVNKMGYKFKGIIGESEALGAGYSFNKRKRKPIYTSLKPGSIIYLDGEFDLQNIYWNASIGEATSIGYGTIFATPL
ncbi:MAG: type III-B CRISPR module-associated Cmr3 family protein [Candidatus Bathyarchaeia archaeon]